MPTDKTAHRPLNLLAVLGFVLTLFPVMPFAGLVLCIIGRRQCQKSGARGKGLAAAGIVLNVLIIAVALAGLLVYISGIGAPEGYI